MRKLKKHTFEELEVVGLIAGLILIICFVAMFVNVQTSRLFMNAAIGMGVILNGVLAALGFLRKRKSLGRFFLVTALLFFLILILRLFLVTR